jgi:hypothetical protein
VNLQAPTTSPLRSFELIALRSFFLFVTSDHPLLSVSVQMPTFTFFAVAHSIQKTGAALSLLSNLGFERVHGCLRFQVFSLVKTGVV